MKFEEIASLILSSPSKTVGAGATEAEIEGASRALGMPIRGGYLEFLRRFGYGGVGDFEIYGLGSGVPKYLHLVSVTQRERMEMFPPLPEHLLPVMNNGAGDHVCLDTRGSPDEPPVVMWWHEDGPDQVPEPTAQDFAAWLAKMLQERAESG